MPNLKIIWASIDFRQLPILNSKTEVPALNNNCVIVK